MKFKKFVSTLVAAACLVSLPTGVFAADGSWDDGRWGKFSSSLSFSTDGGDLKVCVISTKEKVALEIDRGAFFSARELTTAGGGPTVNCATWRGIGDAGTVQLYFGTFTHPSSVEVMIYD